MDSLDFFTDASNNVWRVLLPGGEKELWTMKCMIWVQTNMTRPHREAQASQADDVQQYIIDYEQFVSGRI